MDSAVLRRINHYPDYTSFPSPKARLLWLRKTPRAVLVLAIAILPNTEYALLAQDQLNLGTLLTEVSNQQLELDVCRQTGW